MSQCRPQPMMKKMGFTELAVGPKTHRKNPCTLPARISGVSFFFFRENIQTNPVATCDLTSQVGGLKGSRFEGNFLGL